MWRHGNWNASEARGISLITGPCTTNEKVHIMLL